MTADDCVRTCGGLLAIDKRAPAPKVSPRIFEAYKNRTTTVATTTTTGTTTTSTAPIPIDVTTSLARSTESPSIEETSVEEPDSQKQGLRVRIKQRRRLFKATRNRFSPKPPALTTTTAEPSTTTEAKTTTKSSRFFPTGNRLSRFTSSRAQLLASKSPRRTSTTTTSPPVIKKKESTPAPTHSSILSRINSRSRLAFSPSSGRTRFSPTSSTTTTTTTTTTQSSTQPRPPEVQVRTQTSRSVVVRARPKGGSSNSSPGIFSNPRGRRLPPTLREEPRSFSRSLEGAASVTSSQRRRPNNVQVLQAPPSMKGSGLVVIRKFCRFPPVGGDSPRCRRDKPLYFYDVNTARCEPFNNGYCGRSRNRFSSVSECMETCVVRAKSSSEET